MERLRALSLKAAQRTSVDFQRFLYDKINWNRQLIGITETKVIRNAINKKRILKILLLQLMTLNTDLKIKYRFDCSDLCIRNERYIK